MSPASWRSVSWRAGSIAALSLLFLAQIRMIHDANTVVKAYAETSTRAEFGDGKLWRPGKNPHRTRENKTKKKHDSFDIEENELIRVIKSASEKQVTKVTRNEDLPPRYENDEIDPFYLDATQGFKDAASNLWDDERDLPRWMKVYFRWHRSERSKLKKQEGELFKTFSAEQWNAFRNVTNVTLGYHDGNGAAYDLLYKSLYDPNRFLVMQCVRGQDRKCGGASDRLKPFLAMLRIAYETKRIILIFWTKPYRLEEFLLPPEGGVDWRMPIWLEQILRTNWRRGRQLGGMEQASKYSHNKEPFVKATVQVWDGGRGLYDTHVNATPSYMKTYNATLEQNRQPSFEDLYHIVWKMFFTPASPLRTIIVEEMKRLRLIPRKYIGTHLRALYAVDDRPDPVMKLLGTNAVNCASNLAPGQSMFFASDSPKALSYAREHMNRMTNHSATQRVIWREPVPDPPLHLDFGETDRVSDFYDTFVDLYLLAMGSCGSFNIGGFGQFAILIGGHLKCSSRQSKMRRSRISNPCNWTAGPTDAAEIDDPASFDYESVLLPPIASR